EMIVVHRKAEFLEDIAGKLRATLCSIFYV
nr:hypothetical protein [Tanacetum cinerariifolium]